MRAPGVGTLVALALAGLCGCSPPAADTGAADVAVSVRFEPAPPVVGQSRVELRFGDAQGLAVDAAQVSLQANMSHAGMVPVLAEARELDPGCFAAQLEFTMPGDWFLLVDAKLADGRTLQRRLDLPAVRAP